MIRQADVVVSVASLGTPILLSCIGWNPNIKATMCIDIVFAHGP